MKFLKILFDYLMNIIAILLRFFPVSHSVDLIKFGNPTKDSPIFVSGNWYHIVFRLKKVLKHQDCYLLVVDSAGINVWCGAGVGDFNEHKIADAVNAFNLSEIVAHRVLILPQLGAVGIDKDNLYKECGFKAHWGPANLYDIPGFINNKLKVTEEMRLVKWSARDLINIAIGRLFAYYFFYIYYLVYVLIFGPQYNKYAIFMGIVLFITVLTTAFRIEKPFRWPGIYPLVTGILILIGINFYGLYFNPVLKPDLIVYSLVTLVATFIVFSDMTASDYYKTKFWHWVSTLNAMSLFQPRVTTDCIQCGECISVCPKGLFFFENKAIKLDLSKICCECLACMRQCPTGAIRNTTGKYKKDIKVIPNIEGLMQI